MLFYLFFGSDRVYVPDGGSSFGICRFFVKLCWVLEDRTWNWTGLSIILVSYIMVLGLDCNDRGLVSIRLFSFVSYYTITEYLSTALLCVKPSFLLFFFTNDGYTYESMTPNHRWKKTHPF